MPERDVNPMVELPSAVAYEPRSRHAWLVWLLPVLAIAGAWFLVRREAEAIGPRITIQFLDASGLEEGQTKVRHRGVTVGTVVKLSLAENAQAVLAEVQLREDAWDFAREGARFWVVRPEVNLRGVRGLETVVSGPYLKASPGDGSRRREFEGLGVAPADGESAEASSGLWIELAAASRGSLAIGDPVQYRGVRVGEVRGVALAGDARTVRISVVIEPWYVPLVREGTKFWNASGIEADIGLLGATLTTGSLETILTGGISLAVPEKDAGEIVQAGALFDLESKARDAWLEWSPEIVLDGQGD